MTTNTTVVSPDECLKAMKALAEHMPDCSIMLHGRRGVGKSSLVRQFTKWKGEHFGYQGNANDLLIDLRLTTLDAPDIGGLFYLDHENKRTVSYRPEFLPAADDTRPGVLFFDEISAADQRMQATAYQPLQDREVRGHKIPDGWSIVAAGNDAEDGAISYEMGTALADRLIHFKVVATPQSWLDAARRGVFFAVPEVMTMIQVCPQYLDNTEEQIKEDHLIGASPRGWEKVSRAYAKIKDREILKTIIPGIVGEHIANEFFRVLSHYESEVKVMDILNADKRERRRMLPGSLEGVNGLVFGLQAVVKDADTLIKSFEVLETIRTTENGMIPMAEIGTLGWEMLIQKGYDLKLEDAMVESPVWQAYEDEREAQGLSR